jgi:hypothetical protein
MKVPPHAALLLEDVSGQGHGTLAAKLLAGLDLGSTALAEHIAPPGRVKQLYGFALQKVPSIAFPYLS